MFFRNRDISQRLIQMLYMNTFKLRTKLISLCIIIAPVINISGQQPADIFKTFHNYFYEPQNLGLSVPQVSDFIKYGNINVNYLMISLLKTQNCRQVHIRTFIHMY